MTARRTFTLALYGAALLGALGFGATQALATPRAAATDTCEVGCDLKCILKGYDGGTCRDGGCRCYRLE